MDKVWEGKWITTPDFHGLPPINLFHKEKESNNIRVHKKELKNYHMLIRKTFFIKEEIDINDTYIDISADDYYKLKINGHNVGEGPAPSYFFHYYYNRYNIEKYLKKGKNIISVHVYYQGLVNRVWNSGDYRQGMIAEIYLNKKLFLKTDKSWKYKISNAYESEETIGYETQYLENINFNKVDKNWQNINYYDSTWNNVFEKISDDHKLYLQPTSVLDFYYKKPKKIKKITDGHYFIDFGQNIVGYFEMEIKGYKGEVVEIRHGEELNKDQNTRVRYKMRSNCKYQEYITLSGQKDKLKFYDYKVFRYVEVISHQKNSKSIKPDTFKVLIRHYKFNDDNTTFVSSDELLNKVWEICKNSVKYGVQDGFLDCPGREKGQYLGDTVITGLAHYYLTGDLKLYKKAIHDFALSSYISSGLMAVAPGGLMQEIADYSLQWPFILLKYYKLSGDIDFLKEMYPIAEKLLEYFIQFQREDGLLENVNKKWNLVDWPKSMRDNYDVSLKKYSNNGCHNVINAYFLGMIKNINKIRDILDLEYEDIYPKVKESFIDKFYDKNKKLFVDSENSEHSSLHSNIIPLFYEFIPEDSEESILKLIKNKGLNCGVYMSYYLLKGLSKINEYSLIYKLITNKSKNSWSNMIKEGATTCFEVWSKDQKQNTSLLHPWASAPIIIIIEDLLGIEISSINNKSNIVINTHIYDNIEKINFKMKNNFSDIKIKKNGKKIYKNIEYI